MEGVFVALQQFSAAALRRSLISSVRPARSSDAGTVWSESARAGNARCLALRSLQLENAMNRITATTVAAAALLGLAGSAFAQDGKQSVEVRAAMPVRTDVQALCPAIDEDLPDTLARVAREVSEPAIVDVQFALDGRRIEEVQASGGPLAYRRAVRRAVRGLECSSPDAGRQLVKLRVQFIDPFAARGQRSVALISADPAR
jgi:hypothetical protein